MKSEDSENSNLPYNYNSHHYSNTDKLLACFCAQPASHRCDWSIKPP